MAAVKIKCISDLFVKLFCNIGRDSCTVFCRDCRFKKSHFQCLLCIYSDNTYVYIADVLNIFLIGLSYLYILCNLTESFCALWEFIIFYIDICTNADHIRITKLCEKEGSQVIFH